MIQKRPIQQWKIDEVANLKELLKEYKNIAVIEVAKINDRQIQDIRKVLRNKAIVKMSRKSLQVRALTKYGEESKKPNLDVLAENIPGQSSLVFTNMDIFELKNYFESNKWMVPAKPDAETPVDIWVPEGDTGLPTGQVISELNMTLRLPTMIRNDTIWVREDTRTHKAGDIVDVNQAAVLKKLGVKPLESIIKIRIAWSDGEILPAEVIYMDVEGFKQEILGAYIAAQTLAMELGIVDEETLEPLIKRAYRSALNVLFEMPFFAEDMLDEYVRKAIANANMINATVLGEGLAAPSTTGTVAEAKPDKKDEEGGTTLSGLFGGGDDDDDDDDEEGVGIGGLF